MKVVVPGSFLALVATVLLTGCEEVPTPTTTIAQSACPYENDGECDVPGLCAVGTDTNDCARSVPGTGDPGDTTGTVPPASPADVHIPGTDYTLVQVTSTTDLPARGGGDIPLEGFAWIVDGSDARLQFRLGQPIIKIWIAMGLESPYVWYVITLSTPTSTPEIRFIYEEGRTPKKSAIVEIFPSSEGAYPLELINSVAFTLVGEGGASMGDCTLCPGDDPCWCWCCRVRYNPYSVGCCR